MRPVALGRKNWIHIGSPQAGPKVAAILSVAESCRRLKLSVRDYLAAVLPGFADLPIHARGTQVPLNTPVPGFIASVFRRYRQRASLLTVESKLYTRNPQPELPRAFFELTQSFAAEYATYVTVWIRHAAMAHARKDVAVAISGHDRERLMIVPIPTLDYGDDRIRRVIVTGENGKLVRAAESALAGLNLRSNEGQDMGYLLPADT